MAEKHKSNTKVICLNIHEHKLYAAKSVYEISKPIFKFDDFSLRGEAKFRLDRYKSYCITECRLAARARSSL